MSHRPIIGVIGGHECTPEVAKQAETVGRLIAAQGAILVCGGLDGVMEAVSRGAKQAGGTTIGILPGNDPQEANPYIDIPIVTGIGYARNTVIVRTAQVLIAIRGSYGTLSEIAFALMEGKTVISLGSWEVDKGIIKASSPEEAVSLAVSLIRPTSGS